MRMVAIGCNCSGYKLKEETKRYLEESDISYKDFGTFSEDVLDDPEAVKAVCRAVQKGEADARDIDFRFSGLVCQ